MTESRPDAADGPGPNLPSAPPSVTVRARVVWLDDPDYTPKPVRHATWEEMDQEPVLLPDSNDTSYPVKVALYMEGDDLELLVAEVLGAIAQQWPDDDITVSWSMDENAAEQADTLGVTFPNSHPRSA